MTKSNRIERILYIAVMLAFILAGFFKIITVPSSDGYSYTYMSYYLAVFTDKELSIYGNIFLGLPFLMSAASIVLNIIEICMNKISRGIEQASVSLYLIFFGSGLLFASISDNLMPFGLIICSLFLALILIRVVFHYGIRNMKI